MKITPTLILISCFFQINVYFPQVGINILTPHNTAALQVQSPAGSFKGLLTPSMTTTDRMNITSGTVTPADGLVVYDVSHKMHYYFQAVTNKWISMSAFILSTPATGANNYPSGTITTPNPTVSTTFSVGINKQNPTEALDVTGNTTISGNLTAGGTASLGAANVAGSLLVNGFPVNALVPTGAIIMWSGTLIPVGWAICDGGNYGGLQTPDLRGRFIVGMNSTQGQTNGSGQYIASSTSGSSPSNAPADGTTINYGTLGNTGGETGHTLSLAEMPNHTHNVSVTINTNHVFGFNGPGNTSIGNGTAAGGDAQYVGLTVSETPKGSSQIHENRPPYYVLAYIIKLP